MRPLQQYSPEPVGGRITLNDELECEIGQRPYQGCSDSLF